MPKKRKGANLSCRTSSSRAVRDLRARRSSEQIQEDNANFPFQYEPDVEYYAHSKVVIGTLEKECPHCHALKFKNEPLGMCCSSGKVQLTEIETPPEPLHGLLIGTDPDSSLFLKSIRTFNSCFQMTSFGATEIVSYAAANGQQFNSTFKIKGQVYHKVGSLLPMPNESHKFLQIYFMGGEDSERALANRVDARCDFHNLNSPFARRIVNFESGKYGNHYLLGDGGYFNKNFLLVPISQPQTTAEEAYNKCHIATRNTVERCFGVWKRRCPCLEKGITLNKTSTVLQVIIASAVLHNMCIELNEVEPPSDINITMDDVSSQPDGPNQTAVSVRTALINSIFL
ncbi:unnamed protein product [Euphydryas editha]|uniref:DDE Tnp4 domain-containing protein n=1 Tax=Euphydryas editha TaxID=104508 RepID=A0AAU9UNV0_EUPED|nr:unnamed protein product [Euphydryas editha]